MVKSVLVVYGRGSDPLIMKVIAKRRGGETDTSRDHEYTDWEALARFVESVLAAIPLQKGVASR